jgi:hypothetical protein
MMQLKSTKTVQTGRLMITFCKTIHEHKGTYQYQSWVEGSIVGHPKWNPVS